MGKKYAYSWGYRVRQWIKQYKKDEEPKTLQEAIHYFAIKNALEATKEKKEGEDRIRAIKMCYFEKTKTFAGAAIEIGVSERKIYMWCAEFVKDVGEKAGYL